MLITISTCKQESMALRIVRALEKSLCAAMTYENRGTGLALYVFSFVPSTLAVCDIYIHGVLVAIGFETRLSPQ